MTGIGFVTLMAGHLDGRKRESHARVWLRRRRHSEIWLHPGARSCHLKFPRRFLHGGIFLRYLPQTKARWPGLDSRTGRRKQRSADGSPRNHYPSRLEPGASRPSAGGAFLLRALPCKIYKLAVQLSNCVVKRVLTFRCVCELTDLFCRVRRTPANSHYFAAGTTELGKQSIPTHAELDLSGRRVAFTEVTCLIYGRQ